MDTLNDIIAGLKWGNLDPVEAHDRVLRLFNGSYWVAFDWNKPETRPTKHGKYLVHRKDGKVHWETWNGSGWAYNGKVITYWMEVKLPQLH
jgi:hypothetical protein